MDDGSKIVIDDDENGVLLSLHEPPDLHHYIDCSDYGILDLKVNDNWEWEAQDIILSFEAFNVNPDENGRVISDTEVFLTLSQTQILRDKLNEILKKYK